MKIEYLPTGDDPRPLIRLFNFHPAEVVALRDACISLANGSLKEFQLDTQPWAQPLGGCKFSLRASPKNHGANLPVKGQSFSLDYASEAWLEVADKLEPFTQNSHGFQWLTNEGDVDVLISQAGSW